jgi:alkylation response protein AidB-like acyl-CoA dehydrogenase
VDLSLSPEQRDIQKAFADVFAEQSSPQRVRSAEPQGFDQQLWHVLVGLDAVGIAIDENLGGAGAGLLELVLIAEEAGRRVACVPLVEAVLAARLLAWSPATAARSLIDRAHR